MQRIDRMRCTCSIKGADQKRNMLALHVLVFWGHGLLREVRLSHSLLSFQAVYKGSHNPQ